MGRPAKGAGTRSVVAATRFTPAEADALDGLRGELSRADFLRFLAIREIRREGQGKPLAAVEVRDQTCAVCGSAISSLPCPWCRSV